MGIETIFGVLFGGVVLERIADWIFRGKKQEQDRIVGFVKSAFAQATKIIKDPLDRTLVYHMFRKLLDVGLKAAGVKLSDANIELIERTFDQLWQVYEPDRVSNTLQDLAGKGAKAATFIESVIRDVQGNRARALP
jgi:hypothetical protein